MTKTIKRCNSIIFTFHHISARSATYHLPVHSARRQTSDPHNSAADVWAGPAEIYQQGLYSKAPHLKLLNFQG